MDEKLILVTGGCGYIGIHVVKRLLRMGHAVRIVDKLIWGTFGLEQLSERVELINADVRNVDPRWFQGVDAVIHLAGLSNDPTAEFDMGANYSINYIASKNLVASAKEMGVRIFTYASSAAIYGFHIDDLANEQNEVFPQSDYARTKLMAEQEILKEANDQFATVVLRQGTLFGYSPRMRWDLAVNTFVMQGMRDGVITVHGTGEVWRPMIHVTDIANAHIQCVEAEQKQVNGEIFNLVTTNVKIIDLANQVRDILDDDGVGAQVKLIGATDTRNYRIDGSKFERLVGYNSTVSIEQGVREIMAQFASGGLNTDFDNPKYYNMRWLECMLELEQYFMHYQKAL